MNLSPSKILNFAGRVLYAFLLLLLCYWYQVLVLTIASVGILLVAKGLNLVILAFPFGVLCMFCLYSCLWLFVGFACWGVALSPKYKWPAALVLCLFLVLGNLLIAREASDVPILFLPFNGFTIIASLMGYLLGRIPPLKWLDKLLRPKPIGLAIHYGVAFLIVVGFLCLSSMSRS